MQPGDQHLPQNDRSGQPNPFLPQTHPISRSTAQEIASIQAKLERQLGPEYISDRPGAGGGKVQYLEAWKVINLANEIFGFNGWSSSIQNISVDYMEEDRESGRVNLGLSVVVRVTLKDGVYHEDVGYGSIDRAKSKAAAFEKCKKEGTTDALKRALRNFGNVLGNCLYDKTYLREVSKIKITPPRFDPNHLHRRPEFTTHPKPHFTNSGAQHQGEIVLAAENVKSISDETVFQDQFDDDYFNDYDFEDRPLLVESPRLNEFDSNTLPSVPSPNFSLPPAQVNLPKIPTTNQSTRPRQIPAQHDGCQPARPPPRTIAPETPVPPTDRPGQTAVPLQSSLTAQEGADSPQIPPAAQSKGFLRLSKDGTAVSPYNHKVGNFSPMAQIATKGIDYGKSTPISRARAQSKTPLGNNTDVHNRMGQSLQQGLNQGHRMVGCPPNGSYSPRKPNLHTRVNSASSLGVKRNAQGQVLSSVDIPKGGQSDELSNQVSNQNLQVSVAGPEMKKMKN